MRSNCALGLAFTGSLLVAGTSLAQPIVDGVDIDDADYGTAFWYNTTNPTGFGDNDLPQAGNANGSEMDGFYAVIANNGFGEPTLYMGFTGNLETNFNKFDIFFDYDDGVGQNTLAGDNPDVDFNGLNRMGDEGTGNGLTFDTEFTANAYLTFGNGNYDCHADTAELFASFADLDLQEGMYLGMTTTGDNELTGGTNPFGIQISVNNSNTDGVSSANTSGSELVTTGFEVAIPLGAFGEPTGEILITAFVNGSGHDFMSNQLIGGYTESNDNLGEPREVDLSALAGDQYVLVDQ